jgi:mRNA interferase MazF
MARPAAASRQTRQGEVYWMDFGAASGSEPANRHPCVVVQHDTFNRSAIHTTVVCLITSNLLRAEAPGNVLLARGEAKLPKRSVVNVSQLLTVDKLDLEEKVGVLSPSSLSKVLAGLHMVFEGP